MSHMARRIPWATGRVLQINTDDPFISSEVLATMPRPIDPYHLSNIQTMPPIQAFRTGDWQSVSPEHLDRTGSSGLVREMRPKRTYDMVDIRQRTNMTRVYTQVDHAQPSASYVSLNSHTPAFPTALPQHHPKRRRQHDAMEEQHNVRRWDCSNYEGRGVNKRIKVIPTASSFRLEDGSDDYPAWHEPHRPRAQPVWSNVLEPSNATSSTWTGSLTECPSPTLGHTARFEDTTSSTFTIDTPSSGQSDSSFEQPSGPDFSSWYVGILASPQLSGFRPYRPSIGLMISETEKENRVRYCAKELGGLGLGIVV